MPRQARNGPQWHDIVWTWVPCPPSHQRISCQHCRAWKCSNKNNSAKKYAKTQAKWHVHACAKHTSHRLVVRCCDSWGMAFPEFPNWPLFMCFIVFLNTSTFLRHGANSFLVLYSARYGHMLVPNKCLKLVLGYFGLFRTIFLTSNMADKHTHRSFWGGSWKRQRTASNLCSSRVFIFVFAG